VSAAADIAVRAVDRCGRSPLRLLDIFWEIQDALGWVPPEALEALAPALDRSVLELRDTLTFYHFFHDSPAGRVRIYVDRSALAEVAGADAVVAAFEAELGVRCDDPDPDGTFGLFSTSCIGMCEQLPAALVDGVPVTGLAPAGVRALCAALRAGERPAAAISDRIVTRGPVLLREDLPEVAGLLDLLGTLEPAEILAAVTGAGLRGRGGAGFQTGKKWALCAAQQATPRVVVCNADEGEPGTFKDRYLLRAQFPRVLAGMLLCARAIGASEGFVYLRAEYRYLLPGLLATLQDFRERGWLGADGAGVPGFDVRIQLGAGAYVVGEETALLESLEGKRGEPRVRPPFPVERGYRGWPTVVNNVETFATVPSILELGAEAYAALGTDYSKGTRLLSVAGDCSRPGIHEIVWGQTIGEFLTMVGADDPLFLVVGGPSGTILDARETGRRIALEDLSTGGAVMVFGQDRDLLAVVHNFTRFFRAETCGCCAPCRAGTEVFAEQLAFIRSGRAARIDLERVVAWAKIVRSTARCGLGQTCTNPLTTSIAAFPALYRGRVLEHEEQLRPFDLEERTRAYEEVVAHHEARRRD
jgi:[NiFe] hydrogenase diaphorase moiety large subunit